FMDLFSCYSRMVAEVLIRMQRRTIQGGSGGLEHDDWGRGNFRLHQDVVKSQRSPLRHRHHTCRGTQSRIAKRPVEKSIMISGPVVIKVEEHQDFFPPNQIAPDAGLA